MTIRRVGFTINVTGNNVICEADNSLTPTTGEKVKIIDVRISPSASESTTRIFFFLDKDDLTDGGIPHDCIDDYTHAIEEDCDVPSGVKFVVKASGSVGTTLNGVIEYIEQ